MGYYEDEIRKMLWESVTSQGAALEAGLRGEAEVSTEELLRMTLAKQEALENAVLRLAIGLDQIADD